MRAENVWARLPRVGVMFRVLEDAEGPFTVPSNVRGLVGGGVEGGRLEREEVVSEKSLIRSGVDDTDDS